MFEPKKLIKVLAVFSLGFLITACNGKTTEEASELVSFESIEEPVSSEEQAVESQTVEEAETVEEAGPSAGNASTDSEIVPLLSSIEDIALTSADGKNYTFTYDGRQYKAVYTPDHWKIVASYDINSIEDMTIICQALINEHPIHGRDMVNYRTADDMVYEWEVHNIAHFLFSDKEEAKAHAKDVDFNPEDEGRTFKEYYDKYMGN